MTTRYVKADVDQAKAVMEEAYAAIPIGSGNDHPKYLEYVQAKGRWGFVSQQFKSQQWRARNAAQFKSQANGV